MANRKVLRSVGHYTLVEETLTDNSKVYDIWMGDANKRTVINTDGDEAAADELFNALATKTSGYTIDMPRAEKHLELLKRISAPHPGERLTLGDYRELARKTIDGAI